MAGVAEVNLRLVADFVRGCRLAVQASLAPGRPPQSALVGIVSNDGLEVFFDTLDSTRKHRNLCLDARISLVVGWDLETAQTVQIEGRAEQPSGAELEQWQEVYFARWPEGVARAALPNIAYWLVRPDWVRFSDYSDEEPVIFELQGDELRRR